MENISNEKLIDFSHIPRENVAKAEKTGYFTPSAI
jgi:hypothetical protein